MRLLVLALRTLWDRARPSLGDVTVSAIFDRALATARRAVPSLSRAEMRTFEGPSVEIDDEASSHELEVGLRLVIIEVLALVDGLTGDTLTPALHASLAATRADEPRNDGES